MSVAIDSADEPPVFLCAASVRVTRLEHVWLIRGTVAASRTRPGVDQVLRAQPK